ncbi:MAG TPA: hypothetical protein VM782_15355 [Stellaceae bacterium]|nr:hypothetical protein [Stellaceae bacterium]
MADIDLKRAAIVVAHPDDEVLWFGSLLPRVARVVLCYGMQASGTLRPERGRVIHHYPRGGIEFFDLVQPGSYRKAIWPNATLGPFGMALREPNPAHEQSFHEIVGRLRVALDDVTTVFTHNPWGEYGHEEHTLVHAAVNALKQERKFDLFVSPYVGREMLGLFAQVVAGGVSDVVQFDLDQTLVRAAADLYRGHGAWTWFDTWKWPRAESFFRLGGTDRLRRQPVGFELIDTPRYEA